MFEIKMASANEIRLIGRLDASQVEKAEAVFKNLKKTCKVNFEALEYISSAGLGILLAAQKELQAKGQQLVLVKMNKHIRDIFEWAGFHIIFKIE